MLEADGLASLNQAPADVQLLFLQRWFPFWFEDPPDDPVLRAKKEAAALQAFCFEGCRTRDEKDPYHPVKRLPKLDYLMYLLELFVSERILLIVKSRQVFVSWIVQEYVLWRLLASPMQSVGLLHKKQDDGARHIQRRIKNTLMLYLPDWLKDLYAVQPIKGTFELSHREGKPWESFITSYPQGAEQMRFEAHSVIIWEEMGFQPKAQETWRGAIPTIQSRKGLGGQLIGVSTPEPDSFHLQLMGELLEAGCAVARGDELLKAA